MNRAEKLTTIAENQQKVYEAGYSNAVKKIAIFYSESGYDVENQILTNCLNAPLIHFRSYPSDLGEKTSHEIIISTESGETQKVEIDLGGEPITMVFLEDDGRVRINYEDYTDTEIGKQIKALHTYAGTNYVSGVTAIEYYTDVRLTQYEAGQKSEYDRFWDSYQENGNRTNYQYAFSGAGWNNETFKPKYPIIAKGNCSYTFAYAVFTDFDFVENGVVLDVSKAANVTYMFQASRGIKRIGVLDFTGCTNINRPFYDARIETIDSLVLSENNTYSNIFDYARITNLTIQGTIDKNGFNIQWSTLLTHDSLMSIINALSTTTSGLTVTLSKTAVNNAFETSEGAEDGSTSQEWIDLIAIRSNWTVSLV